MIRYLACGYRDFEKHPVPVNERLNWEIYVVAEGRMAPVFLDRPEVPLESEYVWVLPPGLSYGWRSGEKPPFRYVFHFTVIPDVLRQAAGETGYFCRQLSPVEIRQVDQIYREVEKHAMSVSPLGELQVARAAIDLALLFLNGVKLTCRIPLDQIDARRIEAVQVWYREHMSECPTIDAAASAVNVSSGHLRRMFNRVLACSPHETFLNLRLDRAKELLSTTSLDLQQIGRQCGFGSDSDFCRVFSKCMGISPHQWRIHITKEKLRAK
jgi:AraC-like DNA-binding protein